MDKIQIKKCIYYNLQCIYYNVKQISSFIYAFEGGICCRLKNVHLGKPPLIFKKIFFNSFALVYILLDSSTFVQTHLVICLHSSTFVYTRLHSPSDSSVFLEQIDKDQTRFSLFVIITDSPRFDIKILHSTTISQNNSIQSNKDQKTIFFGCNNISSHIFFVFYYKILYWFYANGE